VDEGASATLDGSDSEDPEGGPLTYRWESLSEAISLSEAETATPAFTAPEVSEDTAFAFVLTVTDEAGLSDNDTVEVLVRDASSNPGEARFGGSEAGRAVLGAAEPGRHERLFVSLSSKIPPDDQGPGRIYASLEVLGIPEWETLIWLLPGDNDEPPYVRLAGTGGAFSPEAERYFYYEGELDGDSGADLGPFEIGGMGSLRGTVLVFKSWYLKEGEELALENLKRIQTVTVSVEGASEGDWPSLGGSEARGALVEDVLLYNLDPDQVDGFDLLLSGRATGGPGKIFLTLEARGLPGLNGFLFCRPGDAMAPPYLVPFALGGRILEGAERYAYYEGELGGGPEDLGPLSMGGLEGARGLVLLVKSWYLEDGLEPTMENLRRIQTVMIAVPSANAGR